MKMEIPKFNDHDPCVEMFYGLVIPIVVFSPRRWTIDGKTEAPDGTFLWDRADKILTRPIPPILLAETVKWSLAQSKQFGKKVPELPPSIREKYRIRNTDHLFELFQPILIWTHRDETTPYVLGSTITAKVNVDLETIPKNISDEEFGKAILKFHSRIGSLAGAKI
jgi:hypothetical protein